MLGSSEYHLADRDEDGLEPVQGAGVSAAGYLDDDGVNVVEDGFEVALRSGVAGEHAQGLGAVERFTLAVEVIAALRAGPSAECPP